MYVLALRILSLTYLLRIFFKKKIFACCIKMQICCHTQGRVLIKFRDRQECFTERQCFWLCSHQFLSVSFSRDSSMWLAGSVALGPEVTLGYTLCCSRAKLLISRWPGSKRGEKGYGDKTCSSKTRRELCPSLQLTSISPLSYEVISRLI